MSKSYGNTINLSDDAETVRKKVMQMYTDPKRIRADIPGHGRRQPGVLYHDAFNPDTAEVEDLKARYRAGKVGRRGGEDEAREGAERAARADARAAPISPPGRSAARDPARRLEKARASRRRRWSGRCRDAVKPRDASCPANVATIH